MVALADGGGGADGWPDTCNRALKPRRERERERSHVQLSGIMQGDKRLKCEAKEKVGSSRCDEMEWIGARHRFGALAVVAENDEVKRARRSN